MSEELKEPLEAPEPWRPEGSFYAIGGDCGWHFVTRGTALEVARQLQRRWPPRWIRFKDLHGSHVRVRARLVDQIIESTPAQRAAERAFARAREQERTQDERSWEDE